MRKICPHLIKWKEKKSRDMIKLCTVIKILLSSVRHSPNNCFDSEDLKMDTSYH